MNILRAFTLACIKIIVNFNNRIYIYFFYINIFLKTPTSKIQEFIIEGDPFIVSHVLVE